MNEDSLLKVRIIALYGVYVYPRMIYDILW